MRAEAQAHVDTINDALALLRRFLDWDRALRRLDELNARVEDPTLWDNAKAAQDVMRERRRLDEAITATRAIESELSDTVELIEMAEAEGDAEMESDGVASLAELAKRADADKVKALLAGEVKKHERVAYGVKVITIVMGDKPGQVPLNKLADHIRKLPKTLAPHQITDIKQRLRALDAVRPMAPMPKGPMPTNPRQVKGARQAMRGR